MGIFVSLYHLEAKVGLLTSLVSLLFYLGGKGSSRGTIWGVIR